MNKTLESRIQSAGSVIIMGHVHPDGDCVGSTLSLFRYIRLYFPEKEVKVYLEKPSEKFSFLAGFREIITEPGEETADFAIALDSSDHERLGKFSTLFDRAAETFNIDHHVTNTGYAKTTICKPDSSSSCEVLYDLLDEDKITKEIAECLYTGIINDTGVFKYSSTSAETMRVAGELMKTGIDFGGLIDRTFYQKNYIQNQILGKALLESMMLMDGRCIYTSLSAKDMDFFEVTGKDLDGIIDQLRLTEGIECAVFIYECGPQEWKVSLRSNYIVDVSKIAMYFGGGGHVRAAGCTMNGGQHDVINALTAQIEEQLKNAGRA